MAIIEEIKKRNFEKLCQMNWRGIPTIYRAVYVKETNGHYVFAEFISLDIFQRGYVVEKETGRTAIVDLIDFERVLSSEEPFENYARAENLHHLVDLLEKFEDFNQTTAEYMKWRSPQFEQILAHLRRLLNPS